MHSFYCSTEERISICGHCMPKCFQLIHESAVDHAQIFSHFDVNLAQLWWSAVDRARIFNNAYVESLTINVNINNVKKSCTIIA